MALLDPTVAGAAGDRARVLRLDAVAVLALASLLLLRVRAPSDVRAADVALVSRPVSESGVVRTYDVTLAKAASLRASLGARGSVLPDAGAPLVADLLVLAVSDVRAAEHALPTAVIGPFVLRRVDTGGRDAAAGLGARFRAEAVLVAVFATV